MTSRDGRMEPIGSDGPVRRVRGVRRVGGIWRCRPGGIHGMMGWMLCLIAVPKFRGSDSEGGA